METPAGYYKRLIGTAPVDGAPVFPNLSTGYSDFDRQCDHIKQLIFDAALLNENSSFGSAVFLTITAIEEIAKAEIGLYRIPGRTRKVKRKNDSLFSHADKQRLAIVPTIGLGSFLQEAMGTTELLDLLERIDRGWLRDLREWAVYSDSTSGEFKTPKDRVLEADSWDVLLLTVEVFDDRLVGFTDHTFRVSEEIKQRLLDD
jgi:AbiV family abortive infection protein